MLFGGKIHLEGHACYNETRYVITFSTVTSKWQTFLTIICLGITSPNINHIDIMTSKISAEYYEISCSVTVEQGQLKCEWTLKYFQGVTGGKWVVSVQWIRDCLHEGLLLQEVCRLSFGCK